MPEKGRIIGQYRDGLDHQYSLEPVSCGPFTERPQKYGEWVHILNDPWLRTMLCRLSSKGLSDMATVYRLLDTIYTSLARIVAGMFFPLGLIHQDTRMIKFTHKGVWAGTIIDPETSVVVVEVPRGGTIPATNTHREFCDFLYPGPRLDVLPMERIVGPEGNVVGVDLSGAKIGGPVGGKKLIIPDGMVATGGTTCRAIKKYKEVEANEPGENPIDIFIVVCLIVTPEGLKTIKEIRSEYPETDIQVVCIRLDRGLSDKSVLKTVPGTYWDREKGLNEKDYIIPGLGGLGEVTSGAEY